MLSKYRLYIYLSHRGAGMIELPSTFYEFDV